MRSIRILLSVTLFIIANALLGVDDQSTTENSASDNLGVPALDPLNQDSTLHSNYDVALNNVAPNNVAPDEENAGSVDSLNHPNLDISSGSGSSSNCASNLNRREESGSTSGKYSVRKELYSL